MDIPIKSFDGFNLDDATYTAWFPGGESAMAREANAIVLPVIGGFARDEGTDPKSITFSIAVSIGGDLATGVDALKVLFRAGATGELVADFGSEQRTRDCRVLGAYPFAGAPNFFVVSLIAADPRWRSAAATVDTHSFTATGQTTTVTNAGNATDDKPVFKLKPTLNKSAATAWKYRRPIVVANRVKRSLTDWPIDVTNGGIDHAALVTAVKSQADGDDVRVLQDGVEIPRYFGEHANTAPNAAAHTTKVWATPKFSAMQDAHLLAAITNVAPANGGSLEVRRGEVRVWPKSGWILNPTSNEVISYTGWTEKNASGNAAFTGIKRAQMGTTAAAGSASDQLVRVEHKLELIYGHTAVAAPEARPDAKPMLDLASSTLTNIRHEWINFYDDLYPTRPGQWGRFLEPRENSARFLYLANAPATPAPTMDFEYDWTLAPVDKVNYNVVRRPIPVGTDGASGHLAFTRVLDATMGLVPLGTGADGVERELDTTPLLGPLTSAPYSAPAGNKVYEAALYARSLVALSVAEIAYGPLPSFPSQFAQVAAVNAAGALFQAVTNNATEAVLVTAVYAMVSEPTTPKRDIVLSVYPDNGSGAANTAYRVFGPLTITAASLSTAGQWLGGYSGYFVLLPGQTVHVAVEVAATTGSNVVWWGVGEAYAYRVLGIGPVDANAHGAHGDNATIDNAVLKFDTAGVPYFALKAEADCYWFNGTLTNTTTLQAVTFSLFISTNDEIEIDVGARTVRNLTTGEEGLLYGVTSTDNEAWLSLVPGANVFRIDETGLAGMDLTVTHSSRWE